MKLQITIDRGFHVLTFSHSLCSSNEARNVIPNRSNTGGEIKKSCHA